MKKILLVEDDIDTLDLVELILNNEGYAVIKANREVSKKEIIGIRPNLVILDFLLSFGLGTDLCAQMKSNVVTKDIPVILYSASANIKELAYQCHADASLEKPFDIDHLVEMVSSLVL